jgi:hypothetical protein
MELTIISIKLGEIELSRELTEAEIERLAGNLKDLVLKLEDDLKKTIEQIKNGIIDLVHYRNENKVNLSTYLSEDLSQDYSSKQRCFRKEGVTIEHYFIAQKIEKQKSWFMMN